MQTAERIPEGLFVRNVCLQCAPQTQQCEGQDAGTEMVLIERDGWGFRRRDRGKGKGLAGGVLQRALDGVFLAARRTCEL